jgi:head-tail adaptor
MAIIAPQTPISAQPDIVELANPKGAPVSNGDGEYTQEYEVFARPFAAISMATKPRMERFTQSGSMAAATHLITIEYMDGISTLTRLYFNGKRYDVLGWRDKDFLGVELELACQVIVDDNLAPAGGQRHRK